MEQFVEKQGLELNHQDIRAGKFILWKEEGSVKGMIGMEPCGEYGLLRSLVFKPEAQAQVPALFETIMALAKEKGMKKIFLIQILKLEIWKLDGEFVIEKQKQLP